MSILFDNNASATNSVQVEIVDTTVTLQTNEGQLFPNPAGADFFICTLEDTSGNVEIVHCTDNTTDVLTVTRAQENTTAKLFPTGTKVELRTTAGVFGGFLQKSGGTMTGELDLGDNILRDPLITDGEARNMPLRGTDGGTGNQLVVPTAGGDPTIGGSTIITAANATYVPESRTITGGEGIAAMGDLTVNRTVDFEFSGLTEMAGTDVLAADLSVVYDDANTEHKKIPYKRAGVPIITDATTNVSPTDDQMNAYWICTNAATVNFDLDIGVGEKGNVLIVQQGGAGAVDFTGGTATVNSAFTSDVTDGQIAVAVLVCTATDVWTLYGNCA